MKKETEKKIMQVHALKILGIGKYKGADYMLQRMGNAFQFIAFWEGNFYQSYTTHNPEKGKKDFTHAQEVEVAVLTMNVMETTIDTLVATKERNEKEKKKTVKKIN